MFIKEYTKPDGSKVTEEYQSWYESTWENFWAGLSLSLLGLFTIISYPVMAIVHRFKKNKDKKISNLDVFIEHLLMGTIYLYIGSLVLIATPWILFKSLFNPCLISSHEEQIEE